MTRHFSPRYSAMPSSSPPPAAGSDATPDATPNATPAGTPEAPPLSPWRCWGGGVVAAAIAWVLYNMTQAIALSFAAKVIHTDNVTTQRIAAAVRTLVVGLSALGTGIFGLAALGLFGLGLQLLLRRNPTPTP
jgi:hypothetical protein